MRSLVPVVENEGGYSFWVDAFKKETNVGQTFHRGIYICTKLLLLLAEHAETKCRWQNR